MTDDIPALLRKIHALEQDIERKLADRRNAMKLQFADGRVSFAHEIVERHLKLKTGIRQFLRESPLKFILTAPVIYGMILPIVMLDLAVSAYQAVCFRAWKIERVERKQYIAIDRHKLAYLNAIQKLNCTYCGYANGVIAYAREIASRTEQFWCPIKHAFRVPGTHERYREFVDYGDAESFIAEAPNYRRDLEPKRACE